MGKQRKNWPADLKQTIVLEVLKGEESFPSIARLHEVSKQLIYKWGATCKGSVRNADESRTLWYLMGVR